MRTGSFFSIVVTKEATAPKTRISIRWKYWSDSPCFLTISTFSAKSVVMNKMELLLARGFWSSSFTLVRYQEETIWWENTGKVFREHILILINNKFSLHRIHSSIRLSLSISLNLDCLEKKI